MWDGGQEDSEDVSNNHLVDPEDMAVSDARMTALMARSKHGYGHVLFSIRWAKVISKSHRANTI